MTGRVSNHGDVPTPLETWNQLSSDKAEAQLLSCCGSRAWARSLAAKRPYATAEALIEQGEALWDTLSEADWLEAFACHPRIGEAKAPATEYLASSELEQFTAQQTLEPVAAALAAGNRLYLERFGFLYIVFASGRTAPELLDRLNHRLTRTRDEELQEAARQQQKITHLRMTRWLLPGRLLP